MALNKAKALQEAEKLVSQGKVYLAIKQYLQIFESDPSDLILLNTVGDLYVREKNIPEAVKQFSRLADTYVRESFTVKAIAIYKKISKLDSGSVEPLLKLAELYTMQGLSREAREQYTQAIDFFRKKGQDDKVLEMLRKIVQVDPENAASRQRLAEFCEKAGRKAEAAQAYLESAQLALRQGETAALEPALKKAAALDPKNPHIRLFKARMALASKRPEEVEKILSSASHSKDEPEARELLLEAYLAMHQLKKAERLVLDVYRANPADFRPLSSYAALCLEQGDLDAALKPLLEVADGLIEQKNTGPLTDALRQLWSRDSHHVPTLELLYRVCERTADELTLPEVLESLGHAYVQSGNLEKAQSAFEKLIEREPDNENYKLLLKQVLQKQGKNDYAPPSPAALANVEMAPTPEVETSPAAVEPVEPAATDGGEAAMVKEALDNSDLFSRYGLVDKAVDELEKVLVVYPDQVDIHERILELGQRGKMERAGMAAAALARIFMQRGDPASAHKYQEIARGHGVPVAAMPERQKTAELDLTAGMEVGSFSPQEPLQDSFSVQAEAPLPESTTASADETEGLDLSDDLAALSAPTTTETVAPTPPPFNYEEAKVEIDFYLEQGFAEEAQKAVAAYETKFPENQQVAELRQRLEEHLATAQAAKVSIPAPTVPLPEVKPATPLPSPPAVPTQVKIPPVESPAARGSVLSNLASDLASSLEGIEEGGRPASSQAVVQAPPGKGGGQGAAPATPLSGLLEELGEPAEAQGPKEDPETHYSLGVAFREMGLLDEAIGEFQKVVKTTQKGKFPPHFLQACTLLASSFMDKKMPAIATKWYLRALEMPDLDEEATLALQYDLGVAYEQSGEMRTALEKFTEVYSQNIDFRDVAEKIRLLQQKVS